MFFVIKRKTLLFFFGALLAIAAAAILIRLPAAPAMSPVHRAARTVVIDAGHGGEDGGAVALSGAVESQINLAIAKKLDALLQLIGEDTQMIRTEDVSVHSANAQTLREKKVSDLKNRAAAVNAVPDAVLISVHQNSLPSVPGVHGAQVFYADTPKSSDIAVCVQQALNQTINTGHGKREKQIEPTIYLMKNVSCPAILVECGFLSNPQETERLQQASHQKKLAVSIAAGFLAADREG